MKKLLVGVLLATTIAGCGTSTSLMVEPVEVGEVELADNINSNVEAIKELQTIVDSRADVFNHYIGMGEVDNLILKLDRLEKKVYYNAYQSKLLALVSDLNIYGDELNWQGFDNEEDWLYYMLNSAEEFQRYIDQVQPKETDFNELLDSVIINE